MKPLRAFVTQERTTVDPSGMPPIVDHYSIPALEEYGAPDSTEREGIDSHKLALSGGELLVSRLNPRKPRVHLVPMRLKAPSVASTEFVALRPRSIEPRYARYLLSSEQVRQELDSRVRSATRSHQRVEPGDILSLRVPVDSELEQARIADFLDDRVARIDQTIVARRRQISLVHDSYLAWLDSWSTEMGARHGWAPLRRFGVRIEQGWSPEADSVPASEGEPGVLKLGSVRGGEFRPNENKAFIPGSEPRPEFRVREGDLLITRANTPSLVGDAAVVRDAFTSDLYLSDLIYRLEIADYDHALASAAIRTPSTRQLIGVIARGTSGSMPKLRGEDLLGLVLPLVPVRHHARLGQQDHDERASRDSQVEALNRTIDLLTEYKQSLITAAVTGELDVRTAGSGVPG